MKAAELERLRQSAIRSDNVLRAIARTQLGRAPDGILEPLTALLREREELLKALRALRAGHTDRDSHCEICPALMDAAIAKAES